MIFSTRRFIKSFTGNNIWGYVLLSFMILLMIYYMKNRMGTISEKSRTQKTQGLGLEFFVKRFIFVDDKSQKFNIEKFKNKAVILNYFISGEEDSLKLIKSQTTLLKILGTQSEDLIFIYVKDDAYKGEITEVLPNMIVVSDWNRSKDIMPITKFPYSIMLDKQHNIAGKVEGYQDWSELAKVEFIRGLLFSR